MKYPVYFCSNCGDHCYVEIEEGEEINRAMTCNNCGFRLMEHVGYKDMFPEPISSEEIENVKGIENCTEFDKKQVVNFLLFQKKISKDKLK